jgi:hypothetical protein
VTETPVYPVSFMMIGAVQQAARRHAGVYVSDDAAVKIAREVLECADDELRCCQSIPGESWKDEAVRDSVRDHMRTQLFVELARKGLLPAAWPRERVMEFSGMGAGMVDVELIVPVRRVKP